MPSLTAQAHTRSVYLETFGCQMNELDSELVRSQLAALGYRFTDDSAAAAVVLYNTCSVREQAENKVLSRLGLLGLAKKDGMEVIVGVIGCMAEREGAAMMRRFPQIDLMCGPGELDKLPMLIDNAFKVAAVEQADRAEARRHAEIVALQGNANRRSATLAAASDNLEMLDLARAFDPDRAPGSAPGSSGGRSAYVRITRGCNKFCTYCVVPYTRGAEVHRPPDHIVDECRKLADQGVIEITLLGQTVNHYIYTHGAAVSTAGLELPQIGPGAAAFAKRQAANRTQSSVLSSSRTTTFADLLKRIHDEVPAIRRLRFLTSYPRDFGDDILHVIADSPRICRYLHAPAQSGSDRILKLMNRGYAVGEYLDFIERARAILPGLPGVPGVCIAGDIIVGFPTETDEDFQLTCDLLRKVRFKNNFIFKYSPRPGTVAMDRFLDDVPEAVKRYRNNALLALQNNISAQVHGEYVGRTVDVLVEKITGAVREAGQAGEAGSRPPAGHAGTAARVELGWERRELPPRGAGLGAGAGARVQLSGRTEGDLIVVFDVSDEAEARSLVGRIVSVLVIGSGPLLLRGALVTTPSADSPRYLGRIAIEPTVPAAVAHV